MNNLNDKAWAITGRWNSGRRFFYYGTWPRRVDAIRNHTEKLGVPWAKAYRKYGHRAVKVRITEVANAEA